MMSIERERRERIVDRLATVFEPYCDIMFVAGSLSYGPNTALKSTSDVDIVVRQKGRISKADYLSSEFNISGMPTARYFDGLSLKQKYEGIDVSVHILNEDSFQVLRCAYVGDLRIFRSDAKAGHYMLNSFDQNLRKRFTVQNVVLPEGGVRTIVPLSFIFRDKENKDRYALGIHRDKIISSKRCIFGQRHFDRIRADVIRKTTYIMLEEEARCGGQLSVENSLSRLHKFDPKFRDEIVEELKRYRIEVRRTLMWGERPARVRSD